ncbi:MAG TPA: cytochrome c oxidase subunit II [Rhizobiales bacterium]|nr:cytochrome c oxidase subunit II [Hyphomicrobiales bacterium]
MNRLFAGACALAAALSGTAAHAAQPTPWQLGMQPAATQIMAQISWFERYTLWFVVPITLLVLALLAYCILRFRASANPTPSRTSHNTMIEVIWTVGPVVVLLAIAVPSFQLLTAQYTPPEEPKLTIKATANQWNWDYEYQSDDPLGFNSALLPESDRSALGKEDVAQYPRLLAVDNELVVPVNVTTRVLVTASDVIHAFAMPAFGIKVDAVPGRINETFFKAEKEGLYYGQCSELCGKDHAFMPIAIRVVSEEKYNSWLAAAKADLAGANRALMASAGEVGTMAVAGN